MRVFNISGSVSVVGSNRRIATIPVTGKLLARDVNEAGKSENLKILVRTAIEDYVKKNMSNKDAARIDLRSLEYKDVQKRGLSFSDLNK